MTMTSACERPVSVATSFAMVFSRIASALARVFCRTSRVRRRYRASVAFTTFWYNVWLRSQVMA